MLAPLRPAPPAIVLLAAACAEAEAARWIAARFEEAGLDPAGEDGWFQPFEAPGPQDCGVRAP